MNLDKRDNQRNLGAEGKPREVETQMTIAKELAGVLEDRIEHLGRRLHAVIGPEKPQSESAAMEEKERGPLAQELRQHNLVLQGLIDKIDNALERLEL